MSATDTGIRCDSCGKFFAYGEVGSSWCFVPDSLVSYEESRDWCAKCTAIHGKPIPHQSVRLDVCCGIYGAAPTTESQGDGRA